MIVNAQVGEHRLADTLNIIFDAPGVRLAAQSVGASEHEGSSVEEEEYYDSLPRVSDSSYVNWHESADPGLATASANETDPPLTVVVEGVQYETESGDLTEPRFAIEYLAPNTGGGEPTHEDLYSTRSNPPSNPNPGQPENPNPPITQPVEPIETQGLNCYRISGYVIFQHTVDGVKRFLPKGTLVRIHDNNGWFIPDYQLYSGYIGDGGRFNFSMPWCDTSTWWDYSKPDPYFAVVAKTDRNLTSHHGFFNYLHEWRTKTYWNHNSYDIISFAILGSTWQACITVPLNYRHIMPEANCGGNSCGIKRLTAGPRDIL